MLREEKVVAATGHRPPKLGGYGADVTEKITTLAYNWLSRFKPAQPVRVISGMALGWDQAVAHAAIMLEIPITAAIPFVTQPDRWPMKSRQHYHWLLGHCDTTVVISPTYSGPEVMQARNRWMVDHCDHLLALWNGTPSGTGHCVKYAQEKGVPMDNLWEQFR